MGILGWILFGFVVGLIARAIMPGKDPLGLIGTTVLGIVGALVAGWFGQAVGWYGPDSGAGFVAATIGAIVLLALYHLIVGRRAIGTKGTSSRRDDFTKAA
jgi:uncharacterized membrane protein YeaQ/YmgE (transglycosylase-associated protein family)